MGKSRKENASQASSKTQAKATQLTSLLKVSKKLTSPHATPKSQPVVKGKPALAKQVKAPKPSPLAPTLDPSSTSDVEREVEEASSSSSSDERDDSDEGNVRLRGFSSDDDDSSDDSSLNDEPSGIEVSKLPTMAKDDETVMRKLEKAKRQLIEDRGVIYIGRLPHGFFEDQLKAYFSQFGDVTRLRVSRNKKTGRSKHRAFLEFDSSLVAQIVAETMDNYLLMGHILQCKVVPKDKVHPDIWAGANRKYRPVPRDCLERIRHDKPRTVEAQAKVARRLIKRQNKRKRKLKEAGISYSFDQVSYKKAKTQPQ